jgi:hypothetical protein
MTLWRSDTVLSVSFLGCRGKKIQGTMNKIRDLFDSSNADYFSKGTFPSPLEQ